MDIWYVYLGIVSFVAGFIGLFTGLFFYLRRRKKAFSSAEPEEKKIEAVKPVDKSLPKGQKEPLVLQSEKKSLTPVKESVADSVLYQGLEKTRRGWVERLADLIRGKHIDASLIESMEEVLIGADIGVKTSTYLLQQVKNRLAGIELKQEDVVWQVLYEETKKLLSISESRVLSDQSSPQVYLIVGVNGAGKTTSIGKLASAFSSKGKKVLLAAGDTFRAAAAEQLEIWGARTNTAVVRGKPGADPSSVIYEAVRQGQKEGVDVVIADTAGRLHVKTQLMDELQKIRRVIQKAIPLAPHETWLVLDATSGQNAMAQAKVFKEMVEVTGVILTKLDGTAKGGIVLGICHELGLPVRYIGVGERAEDLRPFVVDDFVEALYANRHRLVKEG